MISAIQINSKFVFVYFALIFGGLFAAQNIVQRQLISWDVSQYYTYLPATFIYADVGLEKDWPVDLNTHQIGLNGDFNGKTALKMSGGLAYLYAPGFFVAHAIAKQSSTFPADGYSLPYDVMLGITSLLWVALGAYFLFMFLKRFVPNWVAFVSVNVVVFGTNLLYYTVWEGAMSHGHIFALFAILLEVAERYITKQTLWRAVLLGIFAGLLVLIRPILAVHMLVLAAFYLYRLRGKVQVLHVVGILVFAFLVWVPQFAYWRYLSGSWLLYSYGEEGFFWTDPQIVNGLFSWRKGWFIYTPIMFFCVPAMVVLYRNSKTWFWLVFILFWLHVYIIFSWWCWWYGGGFGMRSMIDLYPFLALPVAFFIRWLAAQKWVVWLPTSLVAIALCLFSLKMTSQYANGIIHFDAMSKEAYTKVFLKNGWPKNYPEMLEHPDYEKALKGDRD